MAKLAFSSGSGMNTQTVGVSLVFDQIKLSFGDAYQLEIDRLELPAGRITALLGPSGCGKSTLLNLAAGYLSGQSGVVYHDGAPLQGPASRTALLFQQRNLFPWMTAEKNLAFALENQGLKAQLAQEKARDYLKRVGLQAYAKHYPDELSGGMQQRVGLARALAVRPRLFLMDEPFSALDSYTRQQMYAHILTAWEELQATFLIVTHDIEDALALAHQVIVMRRHPEPGISQSFQLADERPGVLSLAQQQEITQTIYQVMKTL